MVIVKAPVQVEQTDNSPSYGSELPDQFQRINDLLEKNIDFLGDVRELIRERAMLEKEYAVKLQVIARKAADKRSVKGIVASRVIGDDPIKSWDESVLKQSTLETAYAALINSYEMSAQDHANLGEMLSSQIVTELKSFEHKKDDTRRKEMNAFHKALSDRDKIYNDRLRAKQKYDEECIEIETYRQKQDRAQDDKHADRAAKQYEQQRVDMLNSKNTYIVSTEVANKIKDRFYSVDIPVLEDQLQELHAQVIIRLAHIIGKSQGIHNLHLDALKTQVSRVEGAVSEVSAMKDQSLFIEYNARPFLPPRSREFEPCANYYDNGDLNIELTEPKVFLQNKLSRCRAKLTEMAPLIKSKENEASKLKHLLDSYKSNPELGDVDEVTNNWLDAQHGLSQRTTAEWALNAEIDMITNVLGDDQGGQQPHSFKSSSFSIPTTCGLCKSSIWGLSKQGKTCKSCGLSVHSKCELKVPAECPGASRRYRQAAPITRNDGSSSIASSRASVISATSTYVDETPTPSAFGFPSAVDLPTATILFDFVASSPFEVSVTEGDTVRILEEDDGSGWVKVSNGSGAKGLVPATYIELNASSKHASSQSAKIASTLGSGRFVRGIYAYEAQGDDEIEVVPGVRIELTDIGESYAEGWSEGINSKGKKGLFPSNYVEPA